MVLGPWSRPYHGLLPGLSPFEEDLMHEAETPRSGVVARMMRYGLFAGIAVLVVLIFTTQRAERSLNPFQLRPANAEILSAAPDYLAFSANFTNNSKFYLIDTTKHVICVYQLKDDKIRLTAAREFSKDTDIVDSSLDLAGGDGKQMRSPEGGSGFDRGEAENYQAGLKKLLEATEKEKK